MQRFILSYLVVVVSLMFTLVGTAGATNGYQLIGVGQMQNSMAGAVTAAPMDTMTAITNPAGMARVGERADFSMEAFMPVRSVDFTSSLLGGDKAKGGTNLYGVPSVGWVAKAFNREDVYFGGGMFATSGLGVDYGQLLMMPGAALGLPEDVTFDGYSGIQFWKMAPTVAWNVNNALSLGVSLNLDYQSVTMRERIRNVPFWDTPPGPSTMTQRDVNFDLGRPTNQMGFGAGVGLLYDVNDRITLGVSYISEQVFGDGKYRVGTNDILNFNGGVGLPGIYKLDLDYPQQAAIGIALHPSRPLLIDLDIKWINWSGTHDEVALRGPANSFDSNGDGTGDSAGTQLNFGWEDQYVYALGAQYSVTERLNLRAGINYAETPIDEADVFNNLIFPAVVEWHYTLGFDYQLGDHWGIGLAYMRAPEKKIKGKGDVPAGFDAATPFGADSNASISLEENSLGMLLSYKF